MITALMSLWLLRLQKVTNMWMFLMKFILLLVNTLTR